MYVFEDCISLIVINVNSENEYLISNEGILFNKDKSELIQYPKAKTETSYTIPSEVKIIKEESFYGNEKFIRFLILFFGAGKKGKKHAIMAARITHFHYICNR